MKAIFPILIFAVFLIGCSTSKEYIQICPQACKPVVDNQSGGDNGSVSKDWMAYYDRLRKQQISYWLTDVEGRPVTSYDYKHDRGIFESPWRTITTTRENPLPILRVIVLKSGTSDVVIHLIYSDNHENSISLCRTTLEHHKDFDVLYIE
jgi:hypothetical protein